MVTFVAVYRGGSVQDAELVSLTADKRIVQTVARELLRNSTVGPRDPILATRYAGERKALDLIARDGETA